ncbi:MAG: Zn-dependent protease with chaperone function [Pseudohongiellaceae bacterium]
MIRIEGYFLDGKSSGRHQARLEVLPHLPALAYVFVEPYASDTPQTLSLPTTQLGVQSRLGNTPREIILQNNQLFVTDDNDSVDQLAKHLGNKGLSSLLHKLENSLTTIIFACITTAVLTWATVIYGFPAAAKQIAFHLPEFTTSKLGSSLSILDTVLFEPSELSQQRQLEVRQFTQVVLDQYPALHPTLYFRSGMSANALALPNGEIVLTDDFVTLAQDDDEILAVVFHELGHLQGKHIVRRTLQDSMVTLLIIFITGDLDTLDLLTGLPTLVLDLSYSRAFEEEADDFALQAMHQHGIDTNNFAIIMQRLDDHYDSADIKSFLSTHPLTSERIAKAKRFKSTQK